MKKKWPIKQKTPRRRLIGKKDDKDLTERERLEKTLDLDTMDYQDEDGLDLLEEERLLNDSLNW